ncbi:hypothetical protein FSARC_6225 [Fusarium sarcochroum]|uniref:Alpha box domain-containing protein n=1 Tax=Fusarium sarcochroum TaxID=1208366 RepID=A0A8H4TY19_9HYPO|nr:hypothetical protein FSARC_6225 [Fusarium sarcochroum]
MSSSGAQHFTKDDVLRAVAAASDEELQYALSAPGVFEEMVRQFGLQDAAAAAGDGPPPPQDIKNEVSVRAKRPLNAFMAFRTYYLKLFPDVQQKTASGFLTQLWSKDPHRNKWALIAKVYSFVRDQLGKGRVNLSAVLGVVCPMMKIIEPFEYLGALGWETDHDDEGNLVLNQDEAIVYGNMARLQNSNHPATEIDLLSTVLSAGYFSDVGVDLMSRMWANNKGIMTTTGVAAGDAVDDNAPLYEPVPTTAEKTSFVNAVRDDPYQASRDLLGPGNDDAFFQSRFIHSWEVNNLTGFQDVQISIADRPSDPNSVYDFEKSARIGHHAAQFDLDGSIDQTGIIDISSAWSLDEALKAQLRRERDALAHPHQHSEGESYNNV